MLQETAYKVGPCGTKSSRLGSVSFRGINLRDTREGFLRLFGNCFI